MTANYPVKILTPCIPCRCRHCVYRKLQVPCYLNVCITYIAPAQRVSPPDPHRRFRALQADISYLKSPSTPALNTVLLTLPKILGQENRLLHLLLWRVFQLQIMSTMGLLEVLCCSSLSLFRARSVYWESPTKVLGTCLMEGWTLFLTIILSMLWTDHFWFQVIHRSPPSGEDLSALESLASSYHLCKGRSWKGLQTGTVCLSTSTVCQVVWIFNPPTCKPDKNTSILLSICLSLSQIPVLAMKKIVSEK